MFDYATPEQHAIREVLSTFCVEELPSLLEKEKDKVFPRALFNRMGELGLFGLTLPEKYGGTPTSPVTTMLVYEELASHDLGPTIVLSVHLMVSGILSRFASDELSSQILPEIAQGKKLCAFALTEPCAGSDAAALRTRALRTDDGSYLLHGEKCYITSGGFADYYLVFAREPETSDKEGISAFLVAGDAPGLSFSPPEQKMGGERSPISSLYFSDVKVAPQFRIGKEGEGFRIALSALSGGRIAIAACANGIAKSALAHATNHLLTRKQFGQRLCDLQGLQFMIADMQMKLEAAQLLTWQAARERELSTANSRERIYSSYAKCFSTDAAMSITTDAVQLLGGAGYLREYRVEKLMRDAKMLQIVEGTNQLQRAIIAREIFKE